MSLYDKASLVQIPSGVKSGTLYNVVPNTADGDFDFTRGSSATRVNKDGLIETVASGVPRLDYPLLDGVVQDCPALLLEPSRTNRITDTEGWGGFSEVQAVLSDNTSITAPDGSTTGIKTLTSSSTSQPRIEWRGIAVPSTTTTYVWSVFVKKGTTRYVALSHFSDSTQWAVFDLDNGVIQDEAGSDVPAKIENYGSGWYRISKGATITTGQSNNYFKLTIATPSSPSVGVSGETVNIWGFQIEIGLYLSSFIPTTTVGSITTRSADVCNGAEADFNDSEGVLFAEISALSDTTTAYNSIGVGSGSSDNRIGLGFNPSSQIYVFKKTTTSWLSPQSANLELFNKVALSYNTNDNEFWLNGFKVSTNTTIGDITQPNELGFEASYGGEQFYGKSKQVMTFNEALSDTELENLTSWDSFREMATEQLYTIE
jgi:hypothetical protein